MNRTGLLVALCVAAVTGVLFALAPALDMRLAGLFFDASRRMFPLTRDPLAGWLRDAAMWIVAALAAPAVIALALKVIRPQACMLLPGRAALLLLVTLSLGPGLLVNVGLKDHWSRPRPSQVTEFGGTERFMPWWDPRGSCVKNCSFVAGEASGAFWTMAWAALVPPGWRMLAYAGAIGFGLAVGVLRMAYGAHFFSDVVFAGVLMFLIIWLVHGVLCRWRGAPPEAAVVRAAGHDDLGSA